jgi:hypothetical protein
LRATLGNASRISATFASCSLADGASVADPVSNSTRSSVNHSSTETTRLSSSRKAMRFASTPFSGIVSAPPPGSARVIKAPRSAPYADVTDGVGAALGAAADGGAVATVGVVAARQLRMPHTRATTASSARSHHMRLDERTPVAAGATTAGRPKACAPRPATNPAGTTGCRNSDCPARRLASPLALSPPPALALLATRFIMTGTARLRSDDDARVLSPAVDASQSETAVNRGPKRAAATGPPACNKSLVPP